MNTFRLLLRNLIYFRAPAIAVIAGMVVATATLTGALMVGDSVKGSLRALAVQRLGPVDYALSANRFFDESLATRVSESADVKGKFDVVPGIIVTGGVSAGAGDNAQRTGDVQIAGVAGDWAKVDSGATILNSETASVLGVTTGPSRVEFQVPLVDDAPKEGVVARRDVIDTTARLPVDRVQSVAAGNDLLTLFNLNGGQRTPRNAWVPLPALQDAVGQSGKANVLLVHAKSGPAVESQAGARAVAQSVSVGFELNSALKSVIDLPDYGLKVKRAGKSNEASLSASATYLPPAALDAAGVVAGKMGITPRLVTVNLVNRVVKLPGGTATPTTTPATQPSANPDGELHYIIGAGMSALDDGPLAPDEIALNQVTAQQLGASVGDRIRLDYFERRSAGDLSEVSSADKGFIFRVKSILPMSGLGADPSLTPEYKGLTDAPSVSAWDPPKELGIVGDKLKRAEKDNDAYWKTYKASPRLFINIDTARQLWGGPYGDVTSVRIPLEKADEFKTKLKEAIDPATMGFAFRPVKAEQLAAAEGGTDFAGLFVALSFFLIGAAALLVAMLFRLMVEQRARQLGLLSAVGFAPGRLRRLALSEGMILAAVGAGIGLAVAICYTAAIMYGLRTRWVGAVGTTSLSLYVRPMTLAIGFFASLFIALLAVLWGVWRVGKLAPSRLLAGAFLVEASHTSRTGRISRLIGAATVVVGLIVLAMVFAKVIKQAELALAGGALLLAGVLAWLGGALRPRRHFAGGASLSSVTALGVRNASRHTARSVMSVGLIAFAAFTLITVAAFQNSTPPDTGDIKSGAGGFRLVVKAGVPLLGDLNTPAGREQLGVRLADDPKKREQELTLWQAARFTPVRRWAGQDISCLNLTKSNSPTILGVPKSVTDPADPTKFRFDFAGTLTKATNPWSLLETPANENDPVPVVTDGETAEFIMHLGIGDTLPLTDQTGKQRQLKLVGTLSHSMFQGEMLMSDANFRRLFPAQAGFGTVLVDVPADRMVDLQRLLNRELEPYAVSVDTTASRLAEFQKIMNTYLDTFSMLGALGLALGSIGLGVVLIRNVIERRPELALLSALGFKPGDRVKLVLSENVYLLILGMLVGGICALLGILPRVLGAKTQIAWKPLLLTLFGVLVLGFVASVLAVIFSGVRTTTAELRRE